jgi:hypothetical protein
MHDALIPAKVRCVGGWGWDKVANKYCSEQPADFVNNNLDAFSKAYFIISSTR